MDYSLWSGYNSVYRRSYVLAIGGSVFIEAGAVEIFAFSLENHHGVNSEKNWVYGLIITDVQHWRPLCEDFKKRMNIEKDKPDDKNPIIGFGINIEIASVFLKGKNIPNIMHGLVR
ncbi:hypothetical protein RhiirB3_504625 [Rhizophagus irregularis]|nr:hypothetical protein RhiirB3_504625 [Rhizophagus irregularis]